MRRALERFYLIAAPLFSATRTAHCASRSCQRYNAAPQRRCSMFGYYCFDHPFAGHTPPGARAKWGWDANFMSGFFGAEGRPRGRWRGGRMFEQGDLRYVVLRLLEEKPRHGYEIIKALEERFNGTYAPSPGVV